MKKRNDFAPIITIYYDILHDWINGLIVKMPEKNKGVWKKDWFFYKQLKAGRFQSIIMYPFHSREWTGDPTDNAHALKSECSDWAKKEIPVYRIEKKQYVDRDYVKTRGEKAFIEYIYAAKDGVRDRKNGIRPLWKNIIHNSTPWKEEFAQNVQLQIASYLDLLEWLCLCAVRDSDAQAAEILSDFNGTTYFCDIIFALGRRFPQEAATEEQKETTVKEQAAYAADKAEKIRYLMQGCIDRVEGLLDKIAFEGTDKRKNALQEAFEKENITFPEALNRAYEIQHDLIRQDAHDGIWHLYQQYFTEGNGKAPEKVADGYEVSRETEQKYCAAMEKALASVDATGPSIFERYYETMCKAALALYFGIYLNFKDNRIHIFSSKEEIQIKDDENYYAPTGLPLSMNALKEFTGNCHACLLCGGGGSGKSSYLEKIMEIQSDGTEGFSFAVKIPLRFLVSDSTEQRSEINQTLDSSLIWQKVRQVVLTSKRHVSQKELKHIEDNLNKAGGHIAPVLLLLDGYNEVLGLQNRDALVRLREDIQWLSSQYNVRIMMTYRSERALTDSELNSFVGWFISPNKKRNSVFYVAYDTEKMMKVIGKTWVLKNASDQFVELLKTRPMYLKAVKYIREPAQANQYGILNAIYEQRVREVLNGPMVREGKRPFWLALYKIILPELAYRMVISGKEALEYHQFYQEIQDILSTYQKELGNLYWWYEEETSEEPESYPFKNQDMEKITDWIEHALLDTDKIMDRDDNKAVAFFHEDIRNYLAARHIAQRFRLYKKSAARICCYDLSICWERLPQEMYPVVYQALASVSGFCIRSVPKSPAVQVMENVIFPAPDEYTLPELMMPGDWMRWKLASQIQEYEKHGHREVMETFAKGIRPLAEDCLKPGIDWKSLSCEARGVLSWLLCRISQFERLDGNHPVPDAAFEYAKLAGELAEELSTIPGETALWKVARHYYAKACLYQAQYLWTKCGKESWSEAEKRFREGVCLLKECAAEDGKYGIGLNLSNNLLGLWKYSPAPFLQKQAVFREEIGDVEYADAFFYFLNSVAVSPPRSANRPYAAVKCAAMLLEQQVFLPEGRMFSSIEMLAKLLKRSPQMVMTEKAAGHGPLSLSDSKLNGNLRAAELFLKETEGFFADSYDYYQGLYELYCAVRSGKTADANWEKALNHFANEQKNVLKDQLCMAFIDMKKTRAKQKWLQAVDVFLKEAERERKDIAPKDAGAIDRGHRCHNQTAYQNLLQMLSLTLK